MSTPPSNPFNIRIIPVAFGTLPHSWDELVAGRMFSHEDGDGGVTIGRSDVDEAETSFKETETGQALIAWFRDNPDMWNLTLQPR